LDDGCRKRDRGREERPPRCSDPFAVTVQHLAGEERDENEDGQDVAALQSATSWSDNQHVENDWSGESGEPHGC
jgi:hypothetical protein